MCHFNESGRNTAETVRVTVPEKRKRRSISCFPVTAAMVAAIVIVAFLGGMMMIAKKHQARRDEKITAGHDVPEAMTAPGEQLPAQPPNPTVDCAEKITTVLDVPEATTTPDEQLPEQASDAPDVDSIPKPASLRPWRRMQAICSGYRFGSTSRESGFSPFTLDN